MDVVDVGAEEAVHVVEQWEESCSGCSMGFAPVGGEPLARGEGFEFVNKVVGGAIPSQFIPAVEKGVRQVLEEGAIAGYPLQDVRVTVHARFVQPLLDVTLLLLGLPLVLLIEVFLSVMKFFDLAAG